MTRTENTIRNIVVSFGFQAVSIVSNFVIRTVMIRQIGIQAVSLNGLFTEVLSALSLAELGIGSSIVYNLYKPLAEKDREKVCQLMQLFRTAYLVIGAVTFILGIGLCPWIHLLVNSVDYSLQQIRTVYLLFVIDLSIFYLFSYKGSLLMADQKSYISSLVSTVSRLAGLAIKVWVLVATQNFEIYLICSIGITLGTNLLLSYVVGRIYPWLGPPGQKLLTQEKEHIFSNVKNMFVKSLSGKITNSTDHMLISVLVNTLQVGIYSNYALVLGIFKQVANQVAYGGVGAGLGNLLVTEDDQTCIRVFDRLTYGFYLLASVAGVGVFCCISPFITVWLGEGYLLGRGVILICSLNLYLEIITKPLWSIMDVSGLFKQDKNISVIGSTINLILSVFLGLKIGMTGIFLGTFATYLIQTICKANLLFTDRFHTTAIRYYQTMAAMFCGFLAQLVIAAALCQTIKLHLPVYQFIINGFVSCLVVLVTTVCLTGRTEHFRYYLALVRAVVNR